MRTSTTADHRPNLWTPSDYKRWLRHRGQDASKWKMSSCRKADELVRRTTLQNFEAWCKDNIADVEVRMFTFNMVRIHFGSIDVDTLMEGLKMYPEWMEQAQ